MIKLDLLFIYKVIIWYNFLYYYNVKEKYNSFMIIVID